MFNLFTDSILYRIYIEGTKPYSLTIHRYIYYEMCDHIKEV